MEKDIEYIKQLERGMYYQKKQYEDTPLKSYEEVKDMLPIPIARNKKDWIDAYHYAVKILFKNTHKPGVGTGFVSNFVDAAFNEDVFLWDTVFMTLFCNLMHPYVPGICSLDNFYCKQFEDGEIPREMIRATGEDFPLWLNTYKQPLYSYFHNHYGHRRLKEMTNLPYEEMYHPDLGRIVEKNPYLTLDNLHHPLLGLGEIESFERTGDTKRLNEVLEPLYRQYEAMKYHLQHKNGLYVTDWSSMDNCTRNAYLGLAIDTSSEMALFALQLIQIMDILVKSGFQVLNYETKKANLVKDRECITKAVNKMMWNEEDGFYYDVTFEGKQTGIKTIAGFFPLLAGIASKEQAKRLTYWLQDKETFNRIHRVPVLAANEPGFDKEGGYWRGSVWAPTNAIVILGLERYGYYELAKEIAMNHMENIAKVFKDTGTIWENYPADSIGSGNADNIDFVGWSGIAPILYLIEYGIGLKGTIKGVVWEISDLEGKGEIGCKNYWFAGKQGDFTAQQKADGLHIQVNTTDAFSLELRYKGQIKNLQIEGATVIILDEK